MLDLFPSPAIGRFGRRQRDARAARIPVTVLTGFLGAGKTTLVQRLLNSPEGAGTAVVVNEFGAVGIDDALVRASSEQTVLLGNGCLCCITRSDLQVALRRLVADRERGALPPFRRVLIETSGLADPGPILQTFATDRALGGEFHAELTVAVVDAVAGLATLDWSAEARKQAILADRLVVTKTDLADAAAIRQLTARLRALNPRAEIATAIDGAIAPEALTAAPVLAGDIGPGPGAPFVAEADHSDGIVSFVLREEHPIAWEPFARAMETLTALRGADLLRAKGLLAVAGCSGAVLVQFVQHLAHPPIELQRWPDDNRSSRLVFITRNLAETGVRDLFAAVRALAP
jgi:G3E family GTPase